MSRWLTPEQAGPYAHLTTETLALALAGITTPGAGAGLHKDELVAAGLTFAGLPAALAVGRLSNARPGLELLSLVVAEPFRRLGLARQLLAWLQAEARRLGWLSLNLSYPLGHGSTPAMTRLTAPNLGWQRSPGLRLIHLDRAGGQALVTRLAPLAAHWQRSGRFRLTSWNSWMVNRPSGGAVSVSGQPVVGRAAPAGLWRGVGSAEAGCGRRSGGAASLPCWLLWRGCRERGHAVALPALS